MRLSSFIESAKDLIVAEAVVLSRTLAAASLRDEAQLHDHLSAMLRQIAADMRRPRNHAESLANNRGPAVAPHLDSKVESHRRQRAEEGLTVEQLLAEYQALRSSVLRLWVAHGSDPRDAAQDITRFNEAVDHGLCESVRTYSQATESGRRRFLLALGHDLRSPLQAAGLASMAIRNVVQQQRPPPNLSLLGDFSDAVSRSVARMSQLLDSLRNNNLADPGMPMALDFREIDLRAECEEQIALLRAALPHAQITWWASGDCSGHFDAARVREALGNLVVNVLQGGAGSEPICVRLVGSASTVALCVSTPVGRQFTAPDVQASLDPVRPERTSPSALRTRLDSGFIGTWEIACAHKGHLAASCEDDAIRFHLVLPKADTPT